MGRGLAVFAGIPHGVIRASAREAEALGYTSFWVNHPGAGDGIAALAAASRDTRRVELGIGVIPLHSRGPKSIAEGVRAQVLPLDRLLLGVGSANPGALRRVRDGVEELRGTLACRLVVAALGPKMCRLAGAVADGVLFNWLTPEYARRSAETVREGAAEAHRTPPRLMAYVRVAIGGPARNRLQAEATRYGEIDSYAANFKRMGVSPMETCVAADDPAAAARALAAWDGVIDDVVIRVIAGRDTADDHIAVARAAKPATE